MCGGPRASGGPPPWSPGPPPWSPGPTQCAAGDDNDDDDDDDDDEDDYYHDHNHGRVEANNQPVEVSREGEHLDTIVLSLFSEM